MSAHRERGGAAAQSCPNLPPLTSLYSSWVKQKQEVMFRGVCVWGGMFL